MVVVALVFASAAAAATNETVEQVYQRPPEEIARVVDAPFTPSVSVSPDRTKILVLSRPGLPGIDEIAQPELRLAGRRINPRTSGPSREWTFDGLSLMTIDGEDQRPVTGLPENPRISDAEWSPDGRHIAVVLTFEDRLELWVVDAASAASRRLLEQPLSAGFCRASAWLPDGSALLAATVPPDRGPLPGEPEVPAGPVIQQNLGRTAPARTFQDLLEDAHDERVFERLATVQLVRVGLDGSDRNIGEPAMISDLDPSPDGRFILVKAIRRPFSYKVPVSRFPVTVQIWSADGELVHTVAELPLADDVPVAFGSVRRGPRNAQWRQDAGATVVWAEAMDGGDAGAHATVRDRLVSLDAPFDEPPAGLLELDHRFAKVYWGSDDLAIAVGWWWPTRSYKAWRLRPGVPAAEPEVILEYSWEDRYNAPGWPVTRPTTRGTRVLHTSRDGDAIHMIGEGASPEGDRPFLDRMDLATRETTRIFRSEAPFFEQPVLILDTDGRMLLTRRESTSVQPNFWRRDLDGGGLHQITRFPHPNPEFADVQKEQIRYTREDGVELTATLYLPAGFDPAADEPLPMLMWAYPEEFKSADAAGQVTDSPHRFVRVTYWSPMLWLARGYAVLDDPSMPIVGEGEEEPNDTFVEQLVASARAAVEEVTGRGVADPDRIGIGGHSYGAFMTANLLAHSDLYRAGIARSGAYNRTLTPFGFQAEERTLWQAPDIYFAMSPFMHAEKIDEPILLIHGDADNNSGTYPLQSERFYGALAGQGATVRLVMLPHESHGYRARESILHMLWEMSEWLDHWVKAASPRSSEDTAENSDRVSDS
jgi:dipeptidyl aminopeptidase/acylaminoacyl peptidase